MIENYHAVIGKSHSIYVLILCGCAQSTGRLGELIHSCHLSCILELWSSR